MTTFRNRFLRPATIGIALWVSIVVFPLSDYLEGSMSRHVTIQLPLLALAGWLISMDLPEWFLKRLRISNHAGITGVVIAVSTIIFWMIPRSLDESLIYWQVAILKYLSIPIFYGFALGISWKLAPDWLKGFLKVNFLSMLIFLAWLYNAAPVQLCNSYSRDEQLALSTLLVKIAFLLCIFFSLKPLCGDIFEHAFKSISKWRFPSKRLRLADESF